MILPSPGCLRLGLYGAGPHSQGILLPALAGLQHSLEAVFDPRSSMADDLEERFAFRATFSDLGSLVREGGVQALIMSRDAPNLSDIVDPLLKSRLAFWVDAATPGLEKLIGRLSRRKAGNVPTYAVSHPQRYGPAFIRAGELIRWHSHSF